MSPSIDVVVPVLADTPALRGLLDRIAGWRMRPDHVIVVAAEADATLRALCAETDALEVPCRLVEGPATRGIQLDLGAHASDADIVWFLHADAAPPEGALEAIAGAVAAGSESGCFRFAFSGEPTWRKRLIARLVDLRVALGGMVYGDQGLFARRDAYLAAGGFATTPLFEEVPLVHALRRRGTFRALRLALPVATRRWERDGWWHRSLGNRWLAICYMLGVPPERLARRYEESGRAREDGTAP